MLVADLLILLAVLIAGLLAWWLYRACQSANQADWGHPVLNLLDGLNRLLCWHYHRLNRLELNLPAQGPAVVVSNHLSGLDPMLLIASARRPLRFLIATDQYHRFGFTWLFRAVGCIPVDRKGRPDKALRAAINALAEGEVVVVFPHGKIHLPHEPAIKLKSGAANMALKASCAIHPARLSGMRAQGHVMLPVFLRGNARIAICTPIKTNNLSVEQINEAISNCIERS